MTERMDQKLPAAIVARRICELGKWEISNLKLQKLLYLTHMYYSGIFEEGLIKERFRAWKRGPVIPSIYHLCKDYDKKHVPRHGVGWSSAFEGCLRVCQFSCGEHVSEIWRFILESLD